MNLEQINQATLARFRAVTGRNARTLKEAIAYLDHQALKSGYLAIRRTDRRASRVPRFGSAEWCETQGDNLGASPDC